jgi:hypothetical protein
MWGARDDSDRRTVDCIACDASVPRTEAREYDKEGDRWERHGKEFEYLCKSCYRDLCHQPRPGLEGLLAEVEGDDKSRAEFLADYVAAVESDGDRPETGSGRD